MKKAFLIIFTIISNTCLAEIHPVQILNIKDWPLKSLREGKNRGSEMLTLPPHTVGIIYRISTYGKNESQKGNSTITLISQVAAIYAKTGSYDIDNIVAKIFAPFKSRPVNVYLMGDRGNNDIFNLGQSPNYSTEYSRVKNFYGGAFGNALAPVSQASYLWIGLENPSDANPAQVSVSIEAVALVEE